MIKYYFTKEKKEIYGKVSQSLKDYYKTEEGKIELQERNKKKINSLILKALKNGVMNLRFCLEVISLLNILENMENKKKLIVCIKK